MKILGNPISINSLYRGRRFLTDAGRETKDYYAQCFLAQWRKKPFQGDVRVHIDLFFESKRKRDIDGPLKAILDSMSGIVYEDDCQISELLVKRYWNSESPRVEVSVEKVS